VNQRHLTFQHFINDSMMRCEYCWKTWFSLSNTTKLAGRSDERNTREDVYSCLDIIYISRVIVDISLTQRSLNFAMSIFFLFLSGISMLWFYEKKTIIHHAINTGSHSTTEGKFHWVSVINRVRCKKKQLFIYHYEVTTC
jgi:hypothetical protein